MAISRRNANKNTFASFARDKGVNYLCGTTLIPLFSGTLICCIGQTRRSLIGKTFRCAAQRGYKARLPAALHRPAAL